MKLEGVGKARDARDVAMGFPLFFDSQLETGFGMFFVGEYSSMNLLAE